MNELDLHNVRHHDVDRIVENYVLMNSTPINIITGHSGKMRFLVIKVLRRNSFTWYIRCHNSGMITVIERVI